MTKLFTLCTLLLICSVSACPFLNNGKGSDSTLAALTTQIPSKATSEVSSKAQSTKTPSKAPTKTSQMPSKTLSKAPTRTSSKVPTKNSSKPTTRTPSKATTKKPTIAPGSSTVPDNAPKVTSFVYPICLKTGGAQVQYSADNLCTAYNGIKAKFLSIVNDLKSKKTDQANKQLASIFGKAVRMVFHDAVDLDLTQTDLMGADGCLGDAHGSAGLIEQTSPIFTVLEPIYQSFCDKINRADFFVLMGKLVIEVSEPTNSIKLSYQYGRREAKSCSVGVGRDPDAQKGMHAIKQAFVVQMGLSYADAVILSGAHTLGHVNPEFSGYDGHPGWKRSDKPQVDPITVNAWDQSPLVFDNDYYFRIRSIPWGTIYNNPHTFATKPTNTNIWIDFACGGRFNAYPNKTSVNNCFTPKKRLISMNIALNTDMIMTFPMDNTNRYNSLGGNTGSPLEHCIDNVNEEQDVPFAKHYPNQPGREMRCYGPVMKKDVFPPNMKDKIGFRKFLMSDSNKDLGLINQDTDKPIVDPDPIGLNLAAKETYAVFNRYSVNTYQDGTSAGLAAHKRFITDFAQSWTNMITAGYTNSYNNKVGKLGKLTTFDFTTECPASK